MAKLTWGDPETRLFEVGVDQGVLYVGSGAGVAWNGLVSVNEETDGGESNPLYYDGFKYNNAQSSEEYSATIEAFMYPREFEVCDGIAQPLDGFYVSHQKRKSFGLSYRTRIGNGLKGPDYAYKIHLIYNATVEPSGRNNQTIDDNLEANNFTWKVTTRAQLVDGFRNTAHFAFDSRYSPPEALQAIEGILYGTNENQPRLPTVQELFDIYTASATFVVTDNGDGTFSVSGPDILVYMLDATSFSLSGPTVLYVDDDTYTVEST